MLKTPVLPEAKLGFLDSLGRADFFRTAFYYDSYFANASTASLKAP